MQVKKQQLEQTWNNRLVQNWERSLLRLYIFTLLIQLLCRVHHVKHQAGWIRRWNEDCQEKYQNPQIHRWYHSNGRKQRWTKEHFMRVKVKILVTQLCLTLCNPMDCSPSVSSLHGITQGRIERGSISFSKTLNAMFPATQKRCLQFLVFLKDSTKKMIFRFRKL